VFGIGYVEVLVAGVLVAAVLVGLRWGTRSQWVDVDEQWPLAVGQAQIEPPLVKLLGNLPAARLRAGSPGTWTVTVSRSPWWTLFPVVLLFPLGLLFLLFQEQADTQVMLRPFRGGTEVRMIGRTRASVRDAVGKALLDVPSRADA
jgi:hypothetical protein